MIPLSICRYSGRFPAPSSRSSKYLMVLYDHDINTIIPEPIKSRSESDIIRAYAVLHSTLTNRGLCPKLQMLDNECPAGLRHEGITFQLVPHHLHRTNSAERAIQTFKDHLIAGITRCDPVLPLHLWDQLLYQATLTLNLLRPSRINPRLSAEAQLNGAFDFNRTPLAPPGTKALIFESSAKRLTWSPHGVASWYLGPDPKHYPCYRLYVPNDRAERTTKTVQLFPHQFPVPKKSSVNAFIVAERALTEALTNPSPAAPCAQFGDAQHQAIVDLAEIFESAIAKPAIPSIAPPQPAVRTVTPLSLRVPIIPVSMRVTVPPEYPRVNIPPAATRVNIPPESSPPLPLTVSLPVHPHVINLD